MLVLKVGRDYIGYLPAVSKGLPGHVAGLVGEYGRRLRVSGGTKGHWWAHRGKLRT